MTQDEDEADDRGAVAAVLFDRDGTLIHDVPYNGDPLRVRPLASARSALDRLRASSVRLGVVTNQSAIGHGWLSLEQVEAVNDRVRELLGPFDTWQQCPHAPTAGCACRKPAAGLVLAACAELGVPPRQCIVVGDIASDMGAARAAGARGVLVPTRETRAEDLLAAEVVVADLDAAVTYVLGLGRLDHRSRERSTGARARPVLA